MCLLRDQFNLWLIIIEFHLFKFNPLYLSIKNLFPRANCKTNVINMGHGPGVLNKMTYTIHHGWSYWYDTMSTCWYIIKGHHYVEEWKIWGTSVYHKATFHRVWASLDLVLNAPNQHEAKKVYTPSCDFLDSLTQ